MHAAQADDGVGRRGPGPLTGRRGTPLSEIAPS